MAKYEVTRAWHGVSVGDVVDLDSVPFALKSNLRPVRQPEGGSESAVSAVMEEANRAGQAIIESAKGVLAQAEEDSNAIIKAAKEGAESILDEARTKAQAIVAAAGKLDPATPTAATLNKSEITKRLKELSIDFDGRKGAEELAALLPDGDPLKPKAE